MSKHMEFLRKSLDAGTIRVCADAVGAAVGLTAEELITARAASLGAGGKLERFALRDLAGVRVLPNPHASMFEVRFGDGKTARLMYHREAGGDFGRLQSMLEARLGGAGEEAIPVAAPPVQEPAAVAAAAAETADDVARTARMNRIVLALVLIPLVVLYVYSAFSR